MLERSTVRGPAMIGAGAVVRDAYIGPYTAIGEDVTIEHAELEHSIVLAGSTIRDLDVRVEASLIGKNVTIARCPTVPQGLPLRGRRQLRDRTSSDGRDAGVAAAVGSPACEWGNGQGAAGRGRRWPAPPSRPVRRRRPPPS